MKKAKQKIAVAEKSGDNNALSKARAEYDQARWDYFTTPEGQEFLKTRADRKRIDDPEGAAELDKLHAKAVAARKKQAELALAMRLGGPQTSHKVTPADEEFPSHEVQAIVDGQPVGYIQWDHKTGQITGIDVLPEHRGRGVAQSLVDQARDAAKSNRWVAPVKPQDEDEEGDWVGGIHDVPDHSAVPEVAEAKPSEPQGWDRARKEEVLTNTIDPLRQDALFLTDAGYRGVGQHATVAACNEMDYKLDQFGTQIASDSNLPHHQKDEFLYHVTQARHSVSELRFMFQNNERQDRIDNVTADLRQRFMTLGERIAAD